jgi:transmembrane sensor
MVGRHRVTDLGTEFLVRRGSDEMEIALLKGRASLSGESAQTAMLAPGDDAVATPVSIAVTRKTPQELADQLAWQRGVIVFRNTRLADAVREFNRYNETQLVIADPSIADLKFSAEVKINDFDDFLHLAQTVLNLRVDREGTEILISRAARAKNGRAVHVKHSP